MKTCPYCAEEIQDAAIKCRYCQSWLVDEIPASAETPPVGVAVHEPGAAETSAAADAVAEDTAEATEATEGSTEALPAAAATTAAMSSTTEPAPATTAPPAEPQPEWTHSGELYLLGYTDSYFGIWDRRSPTAPTERFPRTDDGWREAWQRYSALERNWMDLRTGQRSS